VTTRGPASAEPARLITPGFLALAAATLAFFIAGGIVLPISPGFARDALGADDLGVGVAIGSFAVAALVLRPIVGWASDRFGRRPLLIGGSLLAVAALGLHLVANDLVMFIGARSLLGAGEGFFFVSALAAASDIAPEERRGEALSFLSLSLYLGIAIGPPIAAWLFSDGSYAIVWGVAMAIAGVAAALSLLVPESAPAVLGRAAGEARKPRRTPLIHPAGLFPGFVILLGLGGMAGFLTFMPLYGPRFGFDNGGLPLTVYALIVVALRVVGATWPDRFGAARLSSIALAVSAVGLAVIGLVPSTVGLLLGTAVFASGVAFTMPALLSVAVSRVAPNERGTVVGTTTVFLDVAFGIGPVVLGAVAARAGYGPAFVAAAASAALGCALLLSRRGAYGRPAGQPTG
jgi:MFS family permease